MESCRRLNMVGFLLVIGIAALQMQNSCAQKTHEVGGSIGWTVPSNGAANYTTWAASQTFSVGDTLVFNFTTNQHTAAEVTKAAFDACTVASPITTWATGPASVTLNSSGPHYYLCTIPSHCSLGQKLAITVGPADATPSAPTPGVSTASPPSPSSASFVAAALPVTLMSIAMALFY